MNGFTAQVSLTPGVLFIPRLHYDLCLASEEVTAFPTSFLFNSATSEILEHLRYRFCSSLGYEVQPLGVLFTLEIWTRTQPTVPGPLLDLLS